MIFCAAGDPGGSRALLPVIGELFRRNVPCAILDHGFLGRELPEKCARALCPVEKAEEIAAASRVYLFGSSSTDTLPLQLARLAKANGVPVMHVLDNWMGYGRRLRSDGLDPLAVDVYAVMDEEARDGALADGVPESSLIVTGHPALSAPAVAPTLSSMACKRMKTAFGVPPAAMHLVFINEPLRAVLGGDVRAASHYGFTEDRVLGRLTAALAPFGNEAWLTIVPHPKDDKDELAALWEKIGNGIAGKIADSPDGHSWLAAADIVIGMASILLYEAWLGGWPLLILQPGGRNPDILRFSRLSGVHFAGTYAAVAKALAACLEQARLRLPRRIRPEALRHAAAPSRIADIAMKLAGRQL